MNALIEKNKMLSKRFEFTGDWSFRFRRDDIEWPWLKTYFCQINNHFSEGVSYSDPFLYPVYTLLTLVMLYTIHRFAKGKAKLSCERLIKAIEEDMDNGKWRNGIRKEDIYNYYESEMVYSEEEFNEKVLPILTQELNHRMHRVINRSGALVWKF